MKATSTLCFLLLVFSSAGKAMEQYEQDEVLAIGYYLNYEPFNTHNNINDNLFDFDIDTVDFPQSPESNYEDLVKNDQNLEKPYPCPWPGCSKRYTTIQNRGRHERSHSPKRYTCSVCGYKCDYPYRLRAHQEKHSKKLFPCKFCQKKFTRPSYVSQHEDRCQN